MNRYIVVNTKKQSSDVWETIGDNYTPSKGEVCIIVPPSDKINIDKETTDVGGAGNGLVYATSDAVGNVILHSGTTDPGQVSPVSIKIGDGTTVFRNLPTLTSGNVQGNWETADPTDPSYIWNKPIMNDDLFQQSEEKTFLIPSSELLSLFNITYNTLLNDNDASAYFTRAELNAIVYATIQGSYDQKDETNINTRVLANATQRAKIIEKLNYFKNHIYPTCKGDTYKFETSQIEYLIYLIENGKALDPSNVDKNALATALQDLQCAEDIQPIDLIEPANSATIKLFKGEKYIKISDHYFHPNDLLIYNDNNWGFYEMRMYGMTDYTLGFTEVEINYLEKFIDGTLTTTDYTYIGNNLKSFMNSQINSIISDEVYRNFLLKKLGYIVNNIEEQPIINCIHILSPDYTTTGLTLNELVSVLVELINAISFTPAEGDTAHTADKLKTLLHSSIRTDIEINKQPRFWFYKYNILKAQEKQIIGETIANILYDYNNRFNEEEQNILITFLTPSASLSNSTRTKLENGLAETLAKKVRYNIDLTVSDVKTYLLKCLALNDEDNPMSFTEDARQMAIKQIKASSNSLSDYLSENEQAEITDALLDKLMEELVQESEDGSIANNTIKQEYLEDNIYYEINNEIIFDTKERAIYMRLLSLQGYFKQTKNLDIIFHYKDRSLDTSFLSSMIADWDKTDPEDPGYIANKPIWKDNNGVVHWQLWFYNQVVKWINDNIKTYIENNYEARLKQIENNIKDLSDKYDALDARVKALEEQQGISQNNFMSRLTSLIVSSDTKPKLSANYFPKIWICTDSNSGHGLVYWRTSSTSEGELNYRTDTTYNWMPISAIWTPDAKGG